MEIVTAQTVLRGDVPLLPSFLGKPGAYRGALREVYRAGHRTTCAHVWRCSNCLGMDVDSSVSTLIRAASSALCVSAIGRAESSFNLRIYGVP